MRPTLLLATFAAALAITGSATAAGNPFGVTVVRFSPGLDAGADARGGHRGRRSRRRRPERDRRARGRARLGGLRLARRLEAARHGPLHRHALRLRPARRPAGRPARRRPAAPTATTPDFDPWHALFQWDDDRMNVQSAWRRTTGDRSIAVAVLDTRRRRRPPRAARHRRQEARRQLHPLRRPEGALRPRRDRPQGPARLPRRRLRGSRHLGREPHRRRAERLRLERRRTRRPDRLLQGARGRPRRALELDALRPHRRVLRPAHRRREHVDRGLRRPLRRGLGPGLPALHRRGRLLPPARRARLRGRRQRARARRPRGDDDRRPAPRGRRPGLDRRPGNRDDASRAATRSTTPTCAAGCSCPAASPA